MRNLIFVLALMLFAPYVLAQQRMEIFALRYKLAEQVLPTLRPLLETGGTMSSMSGKIIVRASPENIEQLRRALDAIDTRSRSLVISVRQGGAAQESDSRIGADGRVVIRNNELRVNGRVQAGSNSNQFSGQTLQTVQTVEDGEASIYLGKSVAMPMNQIVYGPGGAVVSRGTQYVDVGSGFTVRPQLSGEYVLMNISPQNQRISNNGTIEGSRLSTSVRGRLGQWIPLGGVSQQNENSGRGTLDYRDGYSQQSSEYWIKVEALD
jgi:type II secretory pathway component GspD/PulD (secretin)